MKIVYRVQGKNGGHKPMMNFINRLVESGIPFIGLNIRGTIIGSRTIRKHWSENKSSDQLYAAFRESDIVLVKLIADGVCLVADPEFSQVLWQRRLQHIDRKIYHLASVR